MAGAEGGGGIAPGRRTIDADCPVAADSREMTRRKTNQITLVLLLVGLGAALVIFLTATPETVDPLLGDPMTTKKYLRELRVIGGQGNVLAAEFQDWFAGLWHGQALAGTVAVLTAVVTLTFRFVATHPGSEVIEPAGGDDRPRK